MSDKAITIRQEKQDAAPKDAQGWKLHLTYLGAIWAAILLLFFADARDIVGIWWNSSTFNHCLLILPILIWLVARRKEEVIVITPHYFAPGLIYMMVASVGWLLGDFAGVALARQLALVMLLQGAVITILGYNVSRGLLFPLFYAFFMVPIGDELVPWLQTITADMCMFLLNLVDIPAYIDGIFITTPTGYFRVAEACSGIEFLIAMIAYGALVSNICFKSWIRRITFMILCVITPIIANGIRAWGTIYIAHHIGIEFAAGFDHIFYGWIFFALVLLLVMAIGWRWFDKHIDEAAFDPSALVGTPKYEMPKNKALSSIAAIMIIPFLWSSAIAAKSSVVPDALIAPEISGWEKTAYEPLYDWQPYFAGSNFNVGQRYRDSQGRIIDMAIIVFDRQEEGRELIGFGQGSIGPDSDWSWSANIDAPNGAKGERITAPGPVSRDVYSYYRVNGITTGSALTVKLATLLSKLTLSNQQSVAVLISAEHKDGVDTKADMEKFLTDLGTIDDLADRSAGIE